MHYSRAVRRAASLEHFRTLQTRRCTCVCVKVYACVCMCAARTRAGLLPPPALLNSLLTRASHVMSEMSAEEMCEMVGALGTLRYRPDEQWIEAFVTQVCTLVLACWIMTITIGSHVRTTYIGCTHRCDRCPQLPDLPGHACHQRGLTDEALLIGELLLGGLGWVLGWQADF